LCDERKRCRIESDVLGTNKVFTLEVESCLEFQSRIPKLIMPCNAVPCLPSSHHPSTASERLKAKYTQTYTYMNLQLSCLCGLGWRGELSTEDPIPEAAGDAEAVLVIHKVVLEMVLLQLSVVGR
jgi:hypothetical protein